MSYWDTAIRCVEEVKGILLSGFHEEKIIEHKGEVDLVTSVDKAVEEKVIDIITVEHPDHDIMAEESGLTKESKGDYLWIIDPLDGTTNYAHNFPHFSLSIGLEYKGEKVFGLVYQPIADELFIAEKGSGAFLNDRRITVSRVSQLSQSLLGTGFPYDRQRNAELYTTELKTLMEKAQGIRRPGVASLDLCYLACGRYDGFWERKLHPWDVAAGILIVKEAGGMVTNQTGADFHYSDELIIASNGLIHHEMLNILNKP
ncbi:MAG: inositol monophosphatase [Spirochaetota bacterium]|nr:inositol monophosphatase [Spirochaetota bacterium]